MRAFSWFGEAIAASVCAREEGLRVFIIVSYVFTFIDYRVWSRAEGAYRVRGGLGARRADGERYNFKTLVLKMSQDKARIRP